ncbi:ubiquitin carboxyl-terminal hydrolase 2, putative [Plasmodium chabaudi chabaudi]|uniref:Ubiquitin carboxyl-terminal hydrolase 2, putative n=1 Tax=Plasmodium chabaudi chabaudi TaxID=31271 RepID=A0A4V0KA81_PLACU|nr:ubiquitin carboxyl-terminal hydrolase 2, putative [Plasmodium chabaudi chabaudi]VTZ69792.1 ubiquitin carboxyl-terminal hydrolase 2, putative [Plasmodium chabaudi chabaudi]|eukprot:XP_745989.2 ubiquitin carboxyl-terminal hydrolase 2, putative [Plasmodium chabaudi chabaudi]
MSSLSNISSNKNVLLDNIQISNLFKIFDTLPFEPKNENEIWYIINKDFIDNLRNYESGKNTSYDSLINNKIFIEDCDSDVNIRTRLLKEYENGNGISFVLYPEKAIEILEKHFQFDVKIPRSVYQHKTKRKDKIIFKVDIQPLKVVVYSKNTNEHSNPPQMKIVILRSDTIENVLKEIINDFDPQNFKKHLFYAEDLGENKEKNWNCLYISNSNDYPLDKKVYEYDIDEMSCLLITNERVDVKCLTYDNEYSEYNMTSNNLSGSVDNDTPNNPKSINYIFENGGDRGLINLGNTCFLNSSLQCLSKILKFTNYFLSGTFWDHINYCNPVGQHGRLAKAYYETLLEMWKINKKGKPYAPKALKQAISEKRDEFYGYQQHDSQELLAFLLDGLHEDLNLIQKKPYYEEKLQGGLDRPDIEVAEASWKRHKEINNSIIVDLFQGQYRSRLQCPQCNKLSITFDPFMYLSIPLPPKKNHRIWFHVMLSREVQISLRFSSIFSGSQEVLKLKQYFINIIKSLKNKRNSILLHTKNIIKNNKYSHENANAFNFHTKFMDETNDNYETSNEGSPGNGMNNKNNIDGSNYMRALKNKSKIKNTLNEEDINNIYDDICHMCNINTIDDVEVGNLFFLYTRFKNLACNNFFQILNNNDLIAEPHARTGKGISHIFVFMVPQNWPHLIDNNKNGNNYDESGKIRTPDSLISSTGSVGKVRNNNLKDEDMYVKNESPSSIDKKYNQNKSHSNKLGKKRKGSLTSSSNPLRKGEKSHLDNEIGKLDDLENSNDTTTEDTKNGIPNNSSNIDEGNSMEDPKVADLEKEKFTNSSNNTSLSNKPLYLLIVPLCKDEQLLCKMKNNDLPLLVNTTCNMTAKELYDKVKSAYKKNSKSDSNKMNQNRSRSNSVNSPSYGNGYGEKRLKNGDTEIGYYNENDNNNKLYHKNKNISNFDSSKKDNSPDIGLNYSINSNSTNIEENSNFYENKNTNDYCESYLDKIQLYIPSYNLKENWDAKDNLGFALKYDETYISDYIQITEENKLFIIHLDSNSIKEELSVDIKTLTLMDLEEKYSVDTCLKLFSEEEHLDEDNTWYCSNCKLHVQAYKKLDLFRMPIVLILHLKRFNNSNRWLRTKIDSYVYYPHKENEYLDMAPYILEDGLKHMKSFDPSYLPLYELIGVNCHTGGLGGGHYFAYAKLNGQWYNFNDTYVTTIDESQINTKNAYLLFYQLHTYKNEKFTDIAQHRNIAEEEAIRMANASYYN